MRIVAWNAAKKTAGKLPVLMERLHPDVAIICDCTSTDRVSAPEGSRLV